MPVRRLHTEREMTHPVPIFLVMLIATRPGSKFLSVSSLLESSQLFDINQHFVSLLPRLGIFLNYMPILDTGMI